MLTITVSTLITDINVHAVRKLTCYIVYTVRDHETTRAHHGDEIPERDVTYHLTCLLIYH